MEYDGMIWEVVASGINAGINGSNSTAGAGAGAGAAFFLVFFGFFLPAIAAPATATSSNAAKRNHTQLFM